MCFSGNFVRVDSYLSRLLQSSDQLCLSVRCVTVETRYISLLTIDELVGVQRYAVVRCADFLLSLICLTFDE